LSPPVRRSVFPILLLSALVGAATASASFQPLRRTIGSVTIPRVSRGRIVAPAGHADGGVRVIVTLGLAPLAQAYGGGLGYRAGTSRLDVSSSSSRAYLARETAAQAQAIATLHAAIPDARVSWRYRTLLDGFTISLPYAQVPRLMRLGFVHHLYPSLRYKETLNKSRDIIGATQLEAATGASGAGIKIGVVDDGVDETNKFFNPSGFAYPPGFPKGQTAFTTPKVIVARAYPGPGSGAAGNLPLDRRSSFHGTHVAGIAAGDANTTADPGRDHPVVTGLSGVAPRAWIGNYRVFNVPLPLVGGDSAETPEIAKAFEDAVNDGMNVINFSGGGPETDPSRDAMIDVVKNVAAAGVVPVIAAGNDGDDFGPGSVGSPGSAPDAITVAAVSNSHFFGQPLNVLSPSVSPSSLAIVPTSDGLPSSWTTTPQTLVDVGRLTDRNGKKVDRHLCAPGKDPNVLQPLLASDALKGEIALVQRGTCDFLSKAFRAVSAGAIGLIVVDNRPGNPNPLPVAFGFPLATISDLDGAHLYSAMAGTGGKASIEIGKSVVEIETDRPGVMAAFSSAGPTAFGHLLKPDISAPGQQVLSSTLPEFAGSPFAVFDGTSMATPHIAGAAAVLLERHPGWTPKQVKSALMSTAGPAYADTARTTEAPVLREGAGLAWMPGADNPLVFTDPQSLSFGELDAASGAKTNSVVVTVSDAGGGDGTWQVEVHPQTASAGASVDVQPLVTLTPGGSAMVTVTAKAAADAAAGDDAGFVVLRRGSDTRRIPYAFWVTRPGLAGEKVTPLKTLQTGDTRKGTNRAKVYRWPAAPFGLSPTYTGPAMNEAGKEHVYSTTIPANTLNFGVAVESQSGGALVEPWLLGALDENTVQGYAGTPVNMNGIMPDYKGDIGAAGAVYPKPGKYYFSVDSQLDPFTHASLAGSYVLRSWRNDSTPPKVTVVTTRVAAGRPTLVLQATDRQSGVDPYSILIGYGNQLVAAAAYDPASGFVLIPLPSSASKLNAGRPTLAMLVSDNQEAKNVNTIGANALPNTTIKAEKITVVNGPAVTWLFPEAGACAAKNGYLTVLASDTAKITGVTFYDGSKKVGKGTSLGAGGYRIHYPTAGLRGGSHVLRAVVADSAGHTARALRVARVCA
jgi:subtilisin family serine protease